MEIVPIKISVAIPYTKICHKLFLYRGGTKHAKTSQRRIKIVNRKDVFIVPSPHKKEIKMIKSTT